MHPHIATLSELPGYIAIIANDGNHAREIIREWYKTRFYRLPEPYHCHIDGVQVAWVRDQDDLSALADADFPGVAYRIREKGRPCAFGISRHEGAR